MANLTQDIKKPVTLPAPNADFYLLTEVLTQTERSKLKEVRGFMESQVAPVINKYWAEDSFPFDLIPGIRDLKIAGVGYEGYGCAGGSTLLAGFVAMEIARVDCSCATFFGVHSGLAMGSIFLCGSEEQKQKWLPPMSRLEKIGSFGLTEPLVGSGTSGGLTTTAHREGDMWVLNGQKKWIGNATFGDVTIIWARDLADNQVKGFIVENKTTPGFKADKIQNKMALRVVQNALITLPRTRREPPADGRLVSRHRPRTAHDARFRRLGSSRLPDWRVRECSVLRPKARTVRKTDRLVPTGAGPPLSNDQQHHRLSVPSRAALTDSG